MPRTNLVLSLALAAFTGCATDPGMGGDDGGGGGGTRPAMTNGVSTLAGFSQPGYQDGDRQVNLFNNPVNVAYGPDGKLYAADFDNSKLRVIDMDGNATTLIAKQTFSRPFGLVFVGTTLYVSTDRDGQGQGDSDPTSQMNGSVWRIDTGARTATVVVEKIGRPRSLAALMDGRIAIADYAHHVIEILDPSSGTVSPLAGSWNVLGAADGTGSAATFNIPYGLVQRADGKIVVADAGNNSLRLVGLDGSVTTLAGGGTAGYADGAGAGAKFNHPQGVTKTSGGDVYLTDLGNHRIRKVNGDTVSTIAGDGTAGYKDDDNNTAAQFFGLEGLSVKPDGSSIFVADGTGGEDVPYNRIRVIKN